MQRNTEERVVHLSQQASLRLPAANLYLEQRADTQLHAGRTLNEKAVPTTGLQAQRKAILYRKPLLYKLGSDYTNLTLSLLQNAYIHMHFFLIP